MGSLPERSEAEIRQLVLEAQRGDTAAFGQLYDLYFPAIYRYAAFRLPAEAAEDVVADVFVRAWEKLHTYKTHKSVPFAAWLFSIARNAVVDVYRSHRGFEEVPETLPDPDVTNEADHRFRRKELLQTVRTAMDKLPKRYREILVLTFVSELSHAEAGQLLHMSEGGVRILKLRALRKLETLLPPDLDIPA
jgi:RNA polymerase sigma-70 factor (ECF subfamily)